MEIDSYIGLIRNGISNEIQTDSLYSNLIKFDSLVEKTLKILSDYEIYKSNLEGKGNTVIEVEKFGVKHRFKRCDNDYINNFTSNVFKEWENETFRVFEKVKNPKLIALDIGAWIATTSIWLSNNFYHVVSVEPDRESIKCLKSNMEYSGCKNYSLCENPVSSIKKDVIFGPRGAVLNESISLIKNEKNNDLDYVIKSTTLKELIFNYVHYSSNVSLHDVNIGFIKVDIEGGEESIIPDLLEYSSINGCPIYLSFHLSWWDDTNITRYKYLFDYFEAELNDVKVDIISTVINNPFVSLLLRPKKIGSLINLKHIPAAIIGYNQVTYIKRMVKQLEKYTKNIVIIDNNSSFNPLLDYYEKEYKYSLCRLRENHGYKVHTGPVFNKILGRDYLVTDPDLLLNPDTPETLLEDLYNVSEYFKVSKIGLALDIWEGDFRDDIKFLGKSIFEWEKQFWTKKMIYPINKSLGLYSAPIDTAFCFVRKYKNENCIRIAGKYMCKHLPWYNNYQNEFLEGELETYLDGNISTNWIKSSPTPLQLQQPQSQSTNEIEKIYKVKCETSDDINEHLPTLRDYASKCNTVTECGVRFVTSSYAFALGLKGNPNNKLIQIDLVTNKNITDFGILCEKEGINCIFYNQSDLECPMEETDLLFIDTWHVYGHLKRELSRWHSYVKKYIIMHDTTVDEWIGESIRERMDIEHQSRITGIPIEEIKKGLQPAIEEFLIEHKEFVLEKKYTNNNGLTILKRV